MSANPVTSPHSVMLRLVNLRDLIDDMLADKPDENLEANLYSARYHVVRAIRESAVQA